MRTDYITIRRIESVLPECEKSSGKYCEGYCIGNSRWWLRTEYSESGEFCEPDVRSKSIKSVPGRI